MNEENLNEEVKQDVAPEGSAEELKNEAKDTINQVKENLKNVDVKEEAKATKGFIKEMFKNPLGKVTEIAQGAGNFFKTAIILVIVWTVLAAASEIEYTLFGYGEWYENIFDFIKILLTPVLSVLSMSLVLFWLNKKEKKSLTTYIATITSAKLPLILAEVVYLLNYLLEKIDSNMDTITDITSLVPKFLKLIAPILLFFAIKAICNENDEKSAFRKFCIAEAVWVVVYFIVSCLGIYMV